MPARPARSLALPAAHGAGGVRAAAIALLGGFLAAWLAAAPAVLAHGGVVPSEPPSVGSLLFGWTFDPLVWLPAIVALALWSSAVRRVNRAHAANPVPRRRTWSWVAGILVLLVALDSGIATYDATLFSVHMVQHLLLALVAPPLLLYAGPIVLLLRVSSPATRKRWILPVLHSRVVRFLSFPVVAWLLFAGVMWGSHFSPLFNVALENEWAHRLEHGLYLFAALLFWWPVIGPDPSPWRLQPPVRVLYVGMQMPQNTFLALAIYAASAPLYAHYATTARAWGPTPLEDQQLAGGIMWLGGDLLFLAAIIGLVHAWIQDDERRTATDDRRFDVERAAIREREAALVARRAAESGVAPTEPERSSSSSASVSTSDSLH
jgi:cytochrome c oxidase assembly factor CtaG